MSYQINSLPDTTTNACIIPAFTKEDFAKQLNLFSQLPENERSQFLDDFFFHGRQVVLIIPTDEGLVRRVDQSAQNIQTNSDETLLSHIKDNPDLLADYPKKTSDQEFMLKALAVNAQALKYLPEDLQQEEDFFLKALEMDPSGQCLEFADENLRDDIVFLTKALEKTPQAFVTMKRWLQDSPHLTETLYHSLTENLLNLCKDHKNFKLKQKNLACDLYLICVDLQKMAEIEEGDNSKSKLNKLGHKITKRLIKSEDLVLKMLSSNYRFGESVSSDLLKNPHFFEKAVLLNPLVVAYFFDTDFKQEVWIRSFENLLNNLEELIQHPSSTESELVIFYIKIHTYTIYANEHLDQKLSKVRLNHLAKEIIDKISDPQQLIILLTHKTSLIKIIPVNLFENLDLMAKVASIDFEVLRQHGFYSPYLESNIEFWDKALKYNQILAVRVDFSYAPKEFKGNAAIIKRLVKIHKEIVEDIDPELKTQEFALECFRINPSSIHYFHLQDIDVAFIEKASTINPAAILYLNREHDLELIKKLIIKVPQVSAHLPFSLKEALALELCQINPACIEHLKEFLNEENYLKLLQAIKQ